MHLCLPIAADAPRAAPAVPELSGVRVLIVDDNAVNRQVLRERLASWRMRADEADSAGDGLAALRAAADGADPYGIVIADADMPGGHGLSLAHAVRGDEGLRRLVLILLISVDRHGEMDALRDAGFAACLVKPVRASLLMDTLLAVRGAGPGDDAGRLVTPDTLRAPRPERPRDTSSPGAIAARILLAEDNPVNQQVAAAIIQRLGARVDVAGNGKEVLELLALLPYDLVFMDCEMPEMDGYAATAEIRRRSLGGRRLPIVAMTAHAMQGDREQCLAAGMDDYVTKPVNPATIEAVIRRWVHAAPERNAGHASVDASPLLDGAQIAQLCATLGHGDGSLLRTVIDGFIRAVHGRITALRTAIEAGDAPGVRRIAHALRGSALNLGAVRITAVATALEQSDATHARTETTALVDQLQTEIQKLEPALLRLLQASERG